MLAPVEGWSILVRGGTWGDQSGTLWSVDDLVQVKVRLPRALVELLDKESDGRPRAVLVERALEQFLGIESPPAKAPASKKAPVVPPKAERSEVVPDGPEEDRPPVSKPKVVPKSSVGDAKALLAEAEQQAGVGCPCSKAMEKNTGYGIWCDRDKGGCGRKKR